MGESPLIVVAGPTASGKTALAMWLAEALRRGGKGGGEIVSCDSVAVYRGMDIGSAKPTAEERARVQHHCLDLYWPNEECTAGDYARHARAAIAGIRERGKVPIVAGGTGLYLRALLQGLAPAPQRDEALRERLRLRVEQRGAAWLHRMLQRLDARAAAAIHENDVPKVIRSIEVTLAGRAPQTVQWEAGREPLTGYKVTQFVLGPPREALYERINARAAAMFDRGLVEETRGLRDRFGGGCRALGALGYAQAMSVLRGEMPVAEAVAAAQQGHRNYAKRQLTWFRREPEMIWLNGFGDEAAVRESVEGALIPPPLPPDTF
ncbi:tRNA (adenosine(37)-N6)-dimethylallyltransferase MiaA [Granulicella sp. 5B5]|uniref:tRNA (adenosine(37)-N6)-dimethylallyltransferase MiaA n=1 Tax=Granulicella sp. 5B5 TaxID=1617967 RepID=UPI0015F5C175|nr:tRNA (adenosine(37)-N6)-dimethylallyltransferase MiaA [Granulicella sp. 5B5]QMV20384.1 tRNA (adenosine(37)-N6)-dimethylallyltransferase MiaA [Granulicella sp. 5B5]